MLLSMWVRCFRAGNGLAGIVRRLCVETFLLLTRAMADHRSACAGLTRRIRALQQRKRRCEATSALLPSESKLALLVYVLGGKSRPMLVHFLRGIGRRWQRRLQHTDILEDVVWAYRTDPPPETVLSLSKDQFAAGKYVVEYKLFHWVLTQNRCHGVAPSRTQLMEKAQAFVASNVNSAVRSQLCKLFGGKPRAQRKWLARFRKRWSVRLDVLKVQDYVPVEEKRAKARGCSCSPAPR